MQFKFFSLLSFHKVAPILSAIIFISTVIGLNTPSTSSKIICSIIGAASFITFIACAKHHRD